MMKTKILNKTKKAILVYVSFAKTKIFPEDLEEFRNLATSSGVEIVEEIVCRRPSPDPKYFIGQGKVEEIHSHVLLHEAEVVMFNHQLSPIQERNLEKYLGTEIVDYTQLILNIFAKRARSFAGKLQVELARLEHMSTRLVRGWTHLERQRGGIGLRGGPGEKQIEIDRRMLRRKINSLKKRLAKLEKQRVQNRRARKRSRIPVIALVGYTNAGKSTLFNKLVSADVKEDDQLFTTLDPTSRRMYLPNFGSVILIDTVGFIRDLPHELIDAFHATLEETNEADLLLHVIDAHDQEKNRKIEIVNEVLKEIGADKIPQLQVFNKIDLLLDFTTRVDLDENNLPKRVWLSAVNSIGFSLLFDVLQKTLLHDSDYGKV